MNDVINTHPRFAQEMSTVIEERKKLLHHTQPSEADHTSAHSGNGKATAI
jgi:hypothetical protein